jgi:hypothetical protein
MKKLVIIILFNFISNFTFSQTFEETSKWISNNSNGSVQIFYSNVKKQIEFVSVRSAGNSQSAFVNSFNPKDVISISTISDKYGKHKLRLNFKNNGTLVTKAMYDDNSKIVGDINKINMYGFDIQLDCDKEMAERHKKAFVNLFKQLGVTLSNGDIF